MDPIPPSLRRLILERIASAAAEAYSIAFCLRRITMIARTMTASTPETSRIAITLSIFSPYSFLFLSRLWFYGQQFAELLKCWHQLPQ
jgi:hypothetical protein